jgi:hypothetical protein
MELKIPLRTYVFRIGSVGSFTHELEGVERRKINEFEVNFFCSDFGLVFTDVSTNITAKNMAIFAFWKPLKKRTDPDLYPYQNVRDLEHCFSQYMRITALVESRENFENRKHHFVL